MNPLDTVATALADDIVNAGLATRITLGRGDTATWALASPNATDARLTVIASLGSPEICGVWSYTLLSMGLQRETSMRAYFEAFRAAGLGLIAINPNGNGPDLLGSAFQEQFAHAAESLGKRRFGLLGFSMGGGMALQFIKGDAGIATRTAALALIDPTLPDRFHAQRSESILKERTLLVASEDPFSPGAIAATLFGIPAKTFPGLHGEMPCRALADVVTFFSQHA